MAYCKACIAQIVLLLVNKMKIQKSIFGWIESVVITILFIYVGEIIHDPLSLKAYFPWIWFAPVLVALRYGLGPTILSLTLVLATYGYHVKQQITAIPIQLSLLGGFLLSLLCIIFHSRWNRKIAKAQELSSYLEQRVQTVAHAYKIVLFSFNRLEHSMVSSPVTLRSSLEELRQLLGSSASNLDPVILNRFLNILVFHCVLDVAGIYPVENNKVSSEPICSVGIMTLSPDDFLIQEAFEKQSMAYVSTEEILKGHISEYLIAVPMFSQDKIIFAMLVVKEMPFLKLNDDNLEIISFLITYFSDGSSVRGAQLILESYPDCNIDFANELQKLTNLQKKTKQDSIVIALYFLENPHQEDYLFRIIQEKRGLDTLWLSNQANGDKVLLNLMPLTNRYGLEDYRARINNLLNKEFNIELNGQEIKFRANPISSFDEPINLIEDLKKFQ